MFLIVNTIETYTEVNMIKKTLLILTPLLMLSFYQDDEPSLNMKKVAALHADYMKYIHPQKPYLMLDKDTYHAPEKIWFRAFLIDGRSLYPDTLSNHVYVELIDPYDIIVQTIRVRTSDFEGGGSFALSDTVPEGIYQIRAYTNWMKNFSEAYYFTKNILVQNRMHEFIITDKEARKNRREVKQQLKLEEKYNISFFPEGGNYLEGMQNRVAFKAVNSYGEGTPIEGKLLENNDRIVTQFITEHDGMGSFVFTPEQDKNYTAVVMYESGDIEKIKLPVALTNTVGLSVEQNETNFVVSIRSNKIPSADRPANTFILSGEVRGVIYHLSSSNLLDGDTLLVIPKSDFPTGVVRFTLINNRLVPVSERLAFHNQQDFINFDISGRSTTDSLFIVVSPDNLGEETKLIDASISVLLTDSMSSDYSNNLITEMFLTSDLPGYIHNPVYYFQTDRDEVSGHADLLMLTHGWKRYTWHQIVEAEYPEMDYEPESGITVGGKITREIFEFPLRDASVKMYIQDRYNDEFQTYSDRKGEFQFTDLNYEDTIDVKIVARRENGGKNLLIHLEEADYDEILDQTADAHLTTESKINKKAYRRLQNELAREEMKQREKELDSIFSRSIHGRPDFVLWGYELPSGYSNLLDAMQGRIPGVQISGNRIIIRGVGTILGSTDPLVIVDDVPSDVSALRTMPVEDVERVEVLKGPSASMYGSRGGNGVIAVYTKRGDFMKKGEISFSMLGYHVEESFFTPQEEMIRQRLEQNSTPITIYWNPEIQFHDYSIQFAIPAPRTGAQKVIIIEGTDMHGRMGTAFTILR